MKINIQSDHPKFDYQYDGPDHGIIGIYGQSGSGKSNLLNAIAGYHLQLKGHIRFQQKTLFDHTSKNQIIRCAYMQQQPILFPHWDIMTNLDFAQQHNTQQHNITEIIRHLNCLHTMHRLPSELSGGEKQRMAFARTLIQMRKNSLVLLDEPFNAMDQRMKKKALQLLKEKNQQFNCLTLLVTHELSEIYQIADELIYINNGRITDLKSITQAMSSGYKGLPIACKISLNQQKTIVYADDVSIHLDKDHQSSITYQIPVKIKHINTHQEQALVTLECTDNNITDEKSQILALITQDSLRKLQLKTEQKVYAHFKASPYL